MSNGLIECMDRTGHLVFGFSKLPIVRSYRTDGAPLWTAVVRDDYLQLRVSELRHPTTGAVGYSEAIQEDHDRLATIEAVGDGKQLLVQYSRVFPQLKEAVPQSYLVDAATGNGAFLGDFLPYVMSIQPDGYIAAFTDPYSYLEIRKTNGARD